MSISFNIQLDNTQCECLVEYSTYVDQADKSLGNDLVTVIQYIIQSPKTKNWLKVDQSQQKSNLFRRIKS